MKSLYYFLSGLIIVAMPIMKFPQTEITNGLIRAKIYLPDSKNGYYQGTRFDWSGNMPSLEYKGHNYFGQWFKTYSPEIHDVIMGPVEEFTALDYQSVKPGSTFIKIGVGVLTKPDEQPYTFARLYPVVDYGKWTVNPRPDQVQFIHELNDKEYSYKYEKTVQLIKDQPVLVLSHKLKNTGTRTIETSCYDHNFFVIDNQPIGPGYVVRLPYDIKSEGVDKESDFSKIRGRELVYLRNVKSEENIYYKNLGGYGPTANDYDIRIENTNTGAGVRITCDQPFLKLAFWCCATTLCPEPYITIKVEPGQEFQWVIRYEFYTL